MHMILSSISSKIRFDYSKVSVSILDLCSSIFRNIENIRRNLQSLGSVLSTFILDQSIFMSNHFFDYDKDALIYNLHENIVVVANEKKN